MENYCRICGMEFAVDALSPNTCVDRTSEVPVCVACYQGMEELFTVKFGKNAHKDIMDVLERIARNRSYESAMEFIRKDKSK